MDQEHKLNAVDHLIPTIALAVEVWKQANSPEAIAETVHKKLDEQSEIVLCGLLGFEKGYDGKWKIDNCNNRCDTSPAGVYLKQERLDAMQAWLSQIPLPKLTEKMKAQIAADIQRTYESAFKDYVRQQTYSRAQTDARTLIEEITKPLQLENFKKLRSLIAPRNNTPESS